MQECGKGLIALRVDGQRLFFALPEPVFIAPDNAQLANAATALGVAGNELILSAIVDVGAIWFTAQLRSAEKVIALEPNMAALAALGNDRHAGVTVFGLHPAGGAAAIEVRSFAPACGVPEDPVCGSGNGCVAAMIRRHGILSVSAYIATQGRCLGRDGKVQVEFDADGTIWLGGNAVTCVDGSITV